MYPPQERLREVKTALQTEVDAARRMRGEAAQAHASAAADSAAGSEDADIQLYELLAREGAMAEKSRADMAAQQVQAAEAEVRVTLRALGSLDSMHPPLRPMKAAFALLGAPAPAPRLTLLGLHLCAGDTSRSTTAAPVRAA